MLIGLALPNWIAGSSAASLVDYAEHVEAAGFDSTTTIDRIAYPMPEPMTLLAAVAERTARLRLTTNVLVAPTRDPVLLAKSAATLASLSGGRLTLGLAVGARPDDYAAVGESFDDRGARFDQLLATMHAVWRGEPVNGAQHPIVAEPVSVPVLVGGSGERGTRRAVQWGRGWTAGCAPVAAVAAGAERVRAAWTAAGRSGAPWVMASMYFALGDAASASANTSAYYAILGPRVVAEVAADTLRDGAAIRAHIAALEAEGVDEFVLEPTVSDPAQVRLAAQAVGLIG